MAAPSYTTDLVDWILDNDVTAWTELTNAIAGGAPDEADTESALQGTNTVSQSQNTVNLCSMARILATPVDLTGKVALVWHGHGVATALLSYASNGLRVAFATTAADWKSYTVGGSDVPPHPYGKWVNNAVDPSLTPDATNGTTPALSINGIGSMSQLSQAVAKGQPHVCDIIRYGRAEARINGGSLADGYATFAGFAAVNDAQTARWGLIQSTTGGYLWKGLITIGYNAVACQFVDSNKNIYVQDCRKVLSTFNKIEIRTTGTIVDWTGMSFINASPLTSASKGALEVIDDVSVTMNACSFTDMSTFIFKTSSSITSTIFRRCETVTTGGGLFSGCTFDKTTSASAVLTSALGNITGCSFVSDGSSHAVELTSIGAGSMTWDNIATGYATGSTGSPITPTSTGNETIYVNVATASSLTINVAAGATLPSVRVGASFTGSVNVVAGQVTLTITGLRENVEIRIHKLSDGTLLAGAEDHTQMTLDFTDNGINYYKFSYTYVGAALDGTDVFIQVISLAYEIQKINYTMTGLDASIPVQLRTDRNYINP